jgi:glycosyltransferase involved in cell wall biosynthesis
LEQNKKIILTFISYYLPGYNSGGPVRTISNMLNLLAEKYTFKIITRDRDELEHKPYQNIIVNEWSSFKNCEIYYANPKSKLRKVLNKVHFDTYYLNSFFDFNFSIKILMLSKFKMIPAKEIILAPRGELSKGALSLKTIKKNIFLSLAKFLNLYKDVTWHASSEYEAAEIKENFGDNVRIKIAMDIPGFNQITSYKRKEKKKDELNILFISSITPKKNLYFVIDVLNNVYGNFTLDIYGPIKDKTYWQKCQRLVSDRLKNRINYKGKIDNNLLHKVYPNYDLFFFPTLGENFGHVIFESLAYGTPVLCSGNTPWDKLDEFNAGWNISLNDFDKYITIIEKLSSYDNLRYEIYSIGCSHYINNLFNDKQHNYSNFELFKSDRIIN